MKKGTIIVIAICTVLLAAIIFFGVFFTVDEVSVQFQNDVTLADKAGILGAISIDKYANIFALNEKDIKADVEKAFPGNAIEVTSVVRSFPNDVTIVVRERKALFKIAIEGTDKYVAADKDFRRTAQYTEEQLSEVKLIEVKNFAVTDSLAVAECYTMRDIVNILRKKGFADDALPSFISKLEFTEDSVILTTFDNAALIVDRNNAASLSAAYDSYLALDYPDRAGKTF